MKPHAHIARALGAVPRARRLAPLVCARQVTLRASAARRGGAAELADLLRRLREPALQPLDQITPANVKNLELKWVFQAQVVRAWQSTPLVVDGIMYLTQPPNDVVALDAKTGRVFWIYRYTPSPDARVCCGAEQSRPGDPRRHAVHGHARRAPVALDAKTRPPRCGTSPWRDAEARLLDDAGAAGREGQGDRRRRRRRVRRSAASSRRTTRGPARKRGASTRSRARASRATRRGSGDCVEARRRLGVGDRLLRSGAQPDLLGHRQSRARLESGRSGPATTCTPIRSSRSTPTPAS